MLFDLESRSLVQRMALLVVAITLLVSLAISAIGDLMLRHLGADLVQAKLSGRVVANGHHTGIAEEQNPTGAAFRLLIDAKAPPPAASQAAESIGARTSSSIETSDDEMELAALRRTLLLLSLLVFVAVTSIGIYAVCSILEPLKDLEEEAGRLAKGDTSIKFSGLHRSDEVGRIARSLAEVQQSLIEWSRLNAQRADAVSHPSRAVAAAARQLWAAVCAELQNIKLLVQSECHLIVGNFGSPGRENLPGEMKSTAWNAWKAWLTDDARTYVAATSKADPRGV